MLVAAGWDSYVNHIILLTSTRDNSHQTLDSVERRGRFVLSDR